VYSLIDSEKNLAGIVWFTPKIISLGKYKITQTEQQKYQTTLGIRLYGRARGHKLAKPFLRSAIKEYLKLLDKRELYLWLEVHEDNVRAQHLYESMGFRQTAKSADNSQVLLLTQVSGKL
jgi:GNAT superfamily N-acetyltransferase